MSPVHRLSQMGSITTNKIDYPSMLAGYGDFGAMQRIAYQVADGSSAFITFNNVPQTFQDLFLVTFSRSGTTGTTTDIYLRFATGGGAVDSGNNYSTTRLYGQGSSALSDRFISSTLIYGAMIPATSATAGVFASSTLHIPNYTSASANKTVLARGACDLNGSGFTAFQVGLWRNTGAITSVQLLTNASFAAGSTFALYGVRASAA